MIRRLILNTFLVPLCGIIGGKIIKDDFWRNYTKYLNTRRWEWRRKLVLLRDGGICRRCGHKPAYNVHHLTYERVGREKLGDLLLLCDECHKGDHGR